MAFKNHKLTLLDRNQELLMKLIKEGLTTNSGPLKDLFGEFNKESFEKNVANPRLKQFQEKILPQIMERFNATNSALGSGQLNAEINAGKDFQEQLAQLMYEAQQQHSANRITGLQTSLGRQAFENVVEQPKPKSSIWSSIIPAAGTAAGAYLGNPGAGYAAGKVASDKLVGEPGK